MHVHISGQLITIPRQCVCCGGIPDREITATAKRTTGKRVVKVQTRWFQFPYCVVCANHAKLWNRAQIVMNFGGLVAIVAVVLLFKQLFIAVPAGIGLVLLTVYLVRRGRRAARALCKPGCASCAATVRYTAWSGSVHSFDVDSQQYAIVLMLANSKKLVNVSPEVHRLLTQAVQSLTSNGQIRS